MKLRSKLFLLVGGGVALTVGLVTWSVSSAARRTFETLDEQRTAALLSQFRREFTREGEEVVRRVERIASTETLQRMAIDLTRPTPDLAAYVNESSVQAGAHGLDFLDLVGEDGTIVSSAHWPGRFGYRHPWITNGIAAERGEAFLQGEDVPGETVLALMALRRVRAADRSIFVAGGRRLDRRFLGALDLPAGMRALLYENLEPGFSPEQLIDAAGKVADAERLEPLIARARLLIRETTETIHWADGPETFQAIPLTGRDGSVLGVLLLGSSRRELAALVADIRRTAFLLGSVGVVFGLLLSYVLAARVTRPVERLVEGARSVASGNWDVHVDVPASGEVDELAQAFNSMTAELVDQRHRLVQAERVAAWRELARRLAHELKNPLFPLRITVENLQRARRQTSEEFDEVFEESARTLVAEIDNLNTIIGRFGDFAKMPAPRFEQVTVHHLVNETLKLFEPQFRAPGRPPIEVRRDVESQDLFVWADPEQLARALRNLFLNAIDAMPSGGTLTVRTRARGGRVHIEVSDTGEGLTPEECSRLFTPYYTTKQHGTGLGLAIVQSVVSDHHGRISVESARGSGTTFHIELSARAMGD